MDGRGKLKKFSKDLEEGVSYPYGEGKKNGGGAVEKMQSNIHSEGKGGINYL